MVFPMRLWKIRNKKLIQTNKTHYLRFPRMTEIEPYESVEAPVHIIRRFEHAYKTGDVKEYESIRKYMSFSLFLENVCRVSEGSKSWILQYEKEAKDKRYCSCLLHACQSGLGKRTPGLHMHTSMVVAIRKNHVDCVRSIASHEDPFWDEDELFDLYKEIIQHGNISVCEALFSERVATSKAIGHKLCDEAADFKRIDLLEFFHTHGCPLYGTAVHRAILAANKKCFEYAFDNYDHTKPFDVKLAKHQVGLVQDEYGDDKARFVNCVYRRLREFTGEQSLVEGS